jgi:hypothetical protein
MNAGSKLNRCDYENFLVRLYFGALPGSSAQQVLESCIRRAYLDFNRTLRGLEGADPVGEMYDRARGGIMTALTELKDKCKADMRMEQFDEWHKATSSTLTSIYEGIQFKFTVGQAQKWINMSLKYIYVMGEERVDGFGEAYQFCHAPLDNILVGRLPKEFPKLPCAWSLLNNYDEYFDRQDWIRKRFEPEPPLDVEFKFWMGAAPA